MQMNPETPAMIYLRSHLEMLRDVNPDAFENILSKSRPDILPRDIEMVIVTACEDQTVYQMPVSMSGA